MHEYSVAAALLRMVEERARGAGARRVVRVHVCVGALSGVVPELLGSAWEVVRARGACDGAQLAVHATPACWRCPCCAATIPEGAVLRCEDCGAPAELAAGAELRLERIEVEVA